MENFVKRKVRKPSENYLHFVGCFAKTFGVVVIYIKRKINFFFLFCVEQKRCHILIYNDRIRFEICFHLLFEQLIKKT